MQCLFLFRDHSGRLPTAQELRQCGFGVSEAVLPAQEACAPEARSRPLALAAEAPAPYGHAVPQEAPDTDGPRLDAQVSAMPGRRTAEGEGCEGIPGARPPRPGGQGGLARAKDGQAV
jgi:hypothetical protein